MLEIAFYICTSIFLKLSLAVFFARILVERWHRWTIYITVAIYTLFSTVMLFLATLQCAGLTNFLFRQLEHKCTPWRTMRVMVYFHGALNALLDWIFAVLPIFVLRNVQMRWQAKYSVFFILSLGALGSVASLVRLPYVDGLNFLHDLSFKRGVNIAIASIIEPGLGIVAGSLATLRPLLRGLQDRARQIWMSSKRWRNTSRSDSLAVVDSVVASEKLRRAQDSYDTPAVMLTTASNNVVLLSQSTSTSDSCFPSSVEKTNETTEKAWEDLEAARKTWSDRRWNSGGVMKARPILLLPDIEDAGEYGDEGTSPGEEKIII